jgi:ParB-like nuclease domain
VLSGSRERERVPGRGVGSRMNVETVPIGSVRPDPANRRRHGTRNLEAIKGSLLRFGQQKPIVVDEKNVVRAGNGTFAAAVELGWSEIQVVRTVLSGTEARAYALADNHTTDLSDYEPDLLADDLADLLKEGIDVDALGFDEDDVAGPVKDGGESVVVLKSHPVRPPPMMAWVLIGIPTVRFGEIAQSVEALARVPGILCESVLNDADVSNPDPDR